MKYKVLDNKENREFKPELIGSTFSGVASGEYIGLDVNGNNVYILANSVKEIKEVKHKRKLNKTAVINAIQVNKNDIDINIYNEIMSIKRKLRQCTLNDVESIEYSYRKLIIMSYQSGINQISSLILSSLKKACKLIIDSDIKVNCWEVDSVKDWINKGIC